MLRETSTSLSGSRILNFKITLSLNKLPPISLEGHLQSLFTAL